MVAWRKESLIFSGIVWVDSHRPHLNMILIHLLLYCWINLHQTDKRKGGKMWRHEASRVLMSCWELQFSSVAQSCLTLCNAMNCSTPGLPMYYQLPESTQTHVHCVGGAIQPSHPLSSPSPAFNLSQRQGLFQWVSSSHQVAKVKEDSYKTCCVF